MPTCVAPNAFVARDAHLEPAPVICLGSQIGSRAQVGFACIVNTLSSVDHDCVLGDYSQVTAGVTFGGTVVVGKNCFFGIKSGVIPNVAVGDDVVVLAGALVTASVARSGDGRGKSRAVDAPPLIDGIREALGRESRKVRPRKSLHRSPAWPN